jgi:hypothetical protein
MISFADSGYGFTAKPDASSAVAPAGNAAAPTITRVAISPVEAREGAKALSGEARSAIGRKDDGSSPWPASTRAANEGPSGCTWKLVYESELKQMFLDLVERDSDTVVMRIPQESLVKFLRGATQSASSRRGATVERQLDLIA